MTTVAEIAIGQFSKAMTSFIVRKALLKVAIPT